MYIYIMQQDTMHSKYWLGKRGDLSDVRSDAERLMRLSGIRKGIANFVSLMTNDNIPVRFSSGEMSYTDGEKVVVISASNEPKHFDSMVGLALHESSHVLYSQPLFEFLRTMHETDHGSGVFVTQDVFDAYMKIVDAVQNGPNPHLIDTVYTHLRLVINFLEDRRIDLLSYEKLGGYRPYYESLYSRYFYSDMTTAMLKAQVYREPYLRSYEVHLINMFNEHADPDALPGLREIWNIVNLPYIQRYNDDPRWETWKSKWQKLWRSPNSADVHMEMDDLPLIVQDAQKILKVIYENVIAGEPDENEMGRLDEHQPRYDDNGNPTDDPNDSDLENLDQAGNSLGSPVAPGASEDEMEKVRRIQRRMVNGEARKAGLKNEELAVMDNLESADADLREAGGEGFKSKCPVIVYRKFDSTIVESDAFPFHYHRYYGGNSRECPWTKEAVIAGRRMGQVLVHRLRIMNDESTMKYSRQNHGKIDKRLVHQLGYADDNVFSVEQLVRIKPVMVDISIDASGSMAGIKWQRAMTLAVALAYVAEKTRSVRVRINVRTAEDTAVVAILYDSAKDKFEKIVRLFPLVGPTGGTPEGLTFEAMRKELLEEVKNTRRYFINLSDGEPAHSWRSLDYNEYNSYGGLPAARHTAEQVRQIQAAGVRVLSYFITEYDQATVDKMNQNKHTLFHTMYGSTAEYINVESITAIANTMNAFFLKE